MLLNHHKYIQLIAVFSNNLLGSYRLTSDLLTFLHVANASAFLFSPPPPNSLPPLPELIDCFVLSPFFLPIFFLFFLVGLRWQCLRLHPLL